jgi:signal transduction histidine kinase
MTSLGVNRRVLLAIGLGVALPTLVLAALGILLTLRITEAIETQSVRYNRYMAQQVAEGLEQELLAELRESIAAAENVARNGGDRAAILAALAGGERAPFQESHFVPLEQLTEYMLLIVESQPLVYGPERLGPPQRRFAGLMLRDGRGQVVGVGGWWFDAGRFLAARVRTLMAERLANNPRIYGGIESTRHLAIRLLDARDVEVTRVRTPGRWGHAGAEELAGPFAGFDVEVTATTSAPVSWTRRFVWIEITFIALMTLVVLGATLFGLSYTARQLELARIKSSFVSNVSHELKTPISLIRVAVETLEMRRYSSPEEGERFLRRISRETLRLNQLVDNILDFARLEAGQRVFRFTTVDVAELVRETLDSFQPRLEEQSFTLALDVPEELPPVRGDATALGQCLINLLDNAIKYSRTRREIRVAAAARDGSVSVAVTDRGIGISARDQKRIFEKFVRLETGLVHDVKGAGLGLSLVDQIIRAHGGRIEVSSVPGEGSTFTLVLPVAGGAEAAREEPRARTAS